jgi:Fe-S cluster assembly protein SufD
VPSGTYTIAALPFAPTADALERAVEHIAESGERTGSANDAALRRDAFARYAELAPPGARPSRGWRHDYAKLSYDELAWTSGGMDLETLPLREDTSAASGETDTETDQPALATANAGGLFHMGATYFDGGERGRNDERIVLLPLAKAQRACANLLAGVAHQIVDWRADKFAALATAFQNCGAFVYVPDGVRIDAPIQLVFANTEAQDEAVFPHVVVVLGKNARATVLERHVGDGDPFVCGITEVHVSEGAELDYVVVQQAGEGARVITSRAARCERDATMRWHVADLGGTLVRSVVDTRLEQPGSRAEAGALFFNTGMQHVDLASGADHRVGPTTSDTVVRSAATDRGQGRYVGNIVIRPKAHGSDASLRDDALLLSKRAHIDSIPALEIAANDVKAFHGATVGSLDEDALFYAGSRGIARQEALRLITLGFFEPVIARFPGEALRDEVRTALDRKIDDATEIGV